jgi:hypothetical protein
MDSDNYSFQTVDKRSEFINKIFYHHEVYRIQSAYDINSYNYCLFLTFDVKQIMLMGFFKSTKEWLGK